MILDPVVLIEPPFRTACVLAGTTTAEVIRFATGRSRMQVNAPVGCAGDTSKARRWRTTGGRARLILGRERELARIDELIVRAQTGSGGVAVLEGSAGIGKTALLAESMRAADRSGFAVLHGGGARLELEYAFGVVRQLFAGALGSRAQTSDLFDGAARLAKFPLGLASSAAGSAEVSSDPSAAMHGLFWLTANLAERAPVLIAVDDAHWADQMSLRFALYLGRRVDDLAVVLLIVTRPISEQVDNELLVELSALPGATRLRPAPLTEPDVGRLIEHHRLPDADEQFVTACYRATGGNPFLLEELARRPGCGRSEWSRR